MLDLLTLSVEAGMDFMTALQRSIDRRAVDPLGEELIRVIREDPARQDAARCAARHVANACDQSDLRSVVNALVQADELGVSIGVHPAHPVRPDAQRRFDRAEKLANEAPVKMLLPLIGFIFPAVFIVLLGPIALQIMRHGLWRGKNIFIFFFPRVDAVKFRSINQRNECIALRANERFCMARFFRKETGNDRNEPGVLPPA